MTARVHFSLERFTLRTVTCFWRLIAHINRSERHQRIPDGQCLHIGVKCIGCLFGRLSFSRRRRRFTPAVVAINHSGITRLTLIAQSTHHQMSTIRCRCISACLFFRRTVRIRVDCKDPWTLAAESSSHWCRRFRHSRCDQLTIAVQLNLRRRWWLHWPYRHRCCGSSYGGWSIGRALATHQIGW